MNFIFNNVSPIMFPIILSIVIIGTIVVGIELLCQHYDENNDNKKTMTINLIKLYHIKI